MKSLVLALSCFMFLSIFAVSTATATSYPVYVQECSRAADNGFTCGYVDYFGNNWSESYLDAVLASLGCPYLGYGMYFCSVSDSYFAQSIGYSVGVMTRSYSGSSYIKMLYIFYFN
jgi:hypothetical protein